MVDLTPPDELVVATLAEFEAEAAFGNALGLDQVMTVVRKLVTKPARGEVRALAKAVLAELVQAQQVHEVSHCLYELAQDPPDMPFRGINR